MTTPDALRPLRDLLAEKGGELAFADLPGILLEDLAVGWADGRPLGQAAAELLARIDGIPARGRDAEIAGRALLTVLARRGAPVVVRTPADHVRLLGTPEADEGDPEGAAAHARRELEYARLTALQRPYSVDDFEHDAQFAFDAARDRAASPELPGDEIGPEHRLALLGQQLEDPLRQWFHDRHGRDAGDACAWRFFLTARALAHHRSHMQDAGVAGGPAVPRALVEATLATDLGDLARTAVLEPL